ncbi:uncharacterized protein LOC143445622 isoform X2 [Clavelina lepadiformis]|uniref:uncharacterized protein LOC143445622 isoform X2 n=1 Tax=Clavelina lepadiformis TaxID=159417 RepID=UPI004040F832
MQTRLFYCIACTYNLCVQFLLVEQVDARTLLDLDDSGLQKVHDTMRIPRKFHLSYKGNENKDGREHCPIISSIEIQQGWISWLHKLHTIQMLEKLLPPLNLRGKGYQYHSQSHAIYQFAGAGTDPTNFAVHKDPGLTQPFLLAVSNNSQPDQYTILQSS